MYTLSVLGTSGVGLYDNLTLVAFHPMNKVKINRMDTSKNLPRSIILAR